MGTKLLSLGRSRPRREALPDLRPHWKARGAGGRDARDDPACQVPWPVEPSVKKIGTRVAVRSGVILSCS